MDKKYISVDIEASGRIPGHYSLLSIGACHVDNTDIQFYRELQPRNFEFELEAMKISSIGLLCLKGFEDPEYDPKSNQFNPRAVLEILSKKGTPIRQALREYEQWIMETTKGFKPVEIAAPIKYDGGNTSWYMNIFDNNNPFGHSGDDIQSMYRAATGNLNAKLEDLGLRKEGLPHNALEDSVIQAKECQLVFDLIEQNRKIIEEYRSSLL
ncbi:MAG: hypothetical protein KC535_03505 [Nanoarchaeota archaeon]|nr:hypothetical protein [Nanoarchaeota archaeon]